MSGSFTGFSEEYIKKLQNRNTTNENNDKVTKAVTKPKRTVKSTKLNETKIKKVLTTKLLNKEIPQEARLDISDSVEKDNKNELNQTERNILPEPTKTEHDESNSTVIEKKCIDFDEFQAKQKLIEEQNRKRKELLAKALADRTKQTEEEAQRLNAIKNEFKKLDAVLSNDVKILRQQIELASIDYMEAQKRYNKTEKAFLDAKLILQQRLEKKEMLTEHLCTIIEKNEERKADKLMELLNKLDLKADGCDTAKGDHCDIQDNKITSSGE